MENNSIKKLLWNTVGTTINAFASLLYLIMVTRINGVDASGIFSFCFSYSIILYTAANIGGRVFEVSDNNGYSDSCYFSLKFYSSIICMAFALAFCFISGYDFQKTFIIFIFMIIRAIEAFSDTLYAVFQKNDRLDYVGISYVIKNFACFIIFGIVDYLTKSIVLGTVSILVATLLVYVVYDKKILKQFCNLTFVKDRKHVFSLFNTVKYFVLFNLLTIVIPNIPRIIVDFNYSDDDLGYFGILMMIPTVMVLLGQLIVHPYINAITDNYQNNDFKALKTQIYKFTGLIALTSALCSAAAYFVGPFALKILYGISFDAYRLILVTLVVSGMFNAFTVLLSTVLTVFRKTKGQMIIYGFVAIFETVIMYIGLKDNNFTFSFWLYLLVMLIQCILFGGYFICTYKKLSR